MKFFQYTKDRAIILPIMILFGLFFSAPTLSRQIYIEGDFKIISHRDYDYAPSIILDNNKFKMYWCGQDTGDQIFFSESSISWDTWSTPTPVFRSRDTTKNIPSGKQLFDSFHVCDPSIVKARDKYYLYYGGLPNVHADNKCNTKIGVAESLDGKVWKRLNSGLPIVEPARKCPINQYGAGQPSVVYLDGYFYMIYTDTAGFTSKKSNGAGLYMIRSKNPTFTDREIRTPRRWAVAENKFRVTDFRFIESFSADMMYSDVLDNFIIAVHTDPKHTTLIFVDRNLSKARPDMKIEGTWRDGPGLVRKPNGHALPSASCNVVPVPMVRARGGKSPATWDLYMTDADVELDNVKCTPDQLQRTYSGFLVASDDRPLAFITPKGKIQLETTAPLYKVRHSIAFVDSETYDRFKDLGEIKTSQKAIAGNGLPGAFVTSKGYRIQYSCSDSISKNLSKVTMVSSNEYHKYPLGGEIFCNL